MAQVTEEMIDEYIQQQMGFHNFWEYLLYMDKDFFTKRAFLEEVADALQWVYEEYLQGRARVITISMPPRSGKSYIISLFCSWWLGHLPELAIMRNSSGASLYRKLSYDTRKIIKSLKFQNVFPTVKLSPDKQDVRGWNLTDSRQVAYFGAGTDGTIIGYGANLAIYDDLIPTIWVAMNDEALEKIRRWKGADHNSRKELDCPEIGIGTRWRTNDVIGDEIEKGNVNKIFKISALIMDDPEYPEGKSFCEHVNKTEFYLQEKKNLDEDIFNAEYQQEPAELKGLMFPRKELHFYDPKNIDVEKLSIFRLGVIDPAKGGGDFYAFIVGMLIGRNIYIHDMIFNQDDTESNEQASFDFIKKNDINAVKFEGNAAWFLMAKSLRRRLAAVNSNCSIRIIDNTEQKHTRILAQGGFIKNNFWFRSDWEQIPQYRKFINQFCSYMKDGTGKQHDDGADAAAELAKYFREHYKTLW